MSLLRRLALLFALVLTGALYSCSPKEVERRPTRAPLPTRPADSPEAEPYTEVSDSPDAEEPEGEDWDALMHRAWLRREEGDLAQAVELLERCHAGDPASDVYRQWLVDTLLKLAIEVHDGGSREDAIEHADRALELAPEHEYGQEWRKYVDRWRRELEAEEHHWTEDSDLFVLSYDTTRDDILQDSQVVLDHLERTYDDLVRWFGVDPVREKEERPPVRVVLYSESELSRVTGLGWTEGIFDGSVRVAVEDFVGDEARWKETLTHELVHMFVHELGGPDVPAWLNEGLAQYLEASDRTSALRKADEGLGATLVPLEELQENFGRWSDEEKQQIRRAYAQSLLLIELVAREYGDDALRRMVLGCAEGVAPDASFETWTTVPFSFVLELLANR